jgi:hypothetical protein
MTWRKRRNLAVIAARAGIQYAAAYRFKHSLASIFRGAVA